jgi:hypothetical protein
MEFVVLVIIVVDIVVKGALGAILKGVNDVLVVTVIGIGRRSFLGWFRR